MNLNLHIDWNAAKEKARELILIEAGNTLPGPEKMNRVIRSLLRTVRQQLDDAIHPPNPIAEAVSDAAIEIGLAVARSALRHLAQEAYDQLRTSGQVA